jgi:hypothetical protein
MGLIGDMAGDAVFGGESWYESLSFLNRTVSSVQNCTVAGLMMKPPKEGWRGGIHISGKVLPKTGVRAQRMSQQNVAASSLAACHGTQ